MPVEAAAGDRGAEEGIHAPPGPRTPPGAAQEPPVRWWLPPRPPPGSRPRLAYSAPAWVPSLKK